MSSTNEIEVMKSDSSKFFKGSIWWWTKNNNGIENNYYDKLFQRDTMVVVLSEECCGLVTILPVYSPFSKQDVEDLERNPYLVFSHVNDKDCYVYCNRIYTLPSFRLKSFVGKMSDAKMKEIESAISTYFRFSNRNEEDEEILELESIPTTTKRKKKDKKKPGRKSYPVYCNSTDMIYDSVDTASKILCISKASIYKSVNQGVEVRGMLFLAEKPE